MPVATLGLVRVRLSETIRSGQIQSHEGKVNGQYHRHEMAGSIARHLRWEILVRSDQRLTYRTAAERLSRTRTTICGCQSAVQFRRGQFRVRRAQVAQIQEWSRAAE